MESTVVDKALNENFNIETDEPFESSEEEWNPTDCSEDEFDTDITPLVIPKRKNICVTKQLKFKCPVDNCEAVYRKRWLLEDHIRKHNKERPFHCTTEECKKSFTKEAHLKRHKILVHEKSCELVCDVKDCGLIYNNKYSLKKHKNQVHNALKWPFFCNECCIGFKKKWQLNQHNYKHTGEPPFKCILCDIGFTLQRDLTKHNRNHKTYTCDCGQIFERWSHLNLHNKKCSTKQNFICKLCDKRFSKKENLNAHHAFVHQDSKESEIFHCPYLNCTRSYKYKKNVNFHVSFFHEKSNQEEIPCPTCGKIFHMQVYLKRHLKKMHKLPKITKPRAIRKDKNKSRTCTAAILAGLKLSQKEHVNLLNNHKKQLIIGISRIDLGEIKTKLNKSSDDLEQMDSTELIKDLALMEPTNTTGKLSEDTSIMLEDNSTNSDKLKDFKHNIQLKNLIDINNQRLEESDNGVLENKIHTTGTLSEDKSITMQDSINSDSIIYLEQKIQLKNLNDQVNNPILENSDNEVLENVVQTEDHQISINISRIDVSEIANKVNKSNDVKQTDTSELKELPLIEQTKKENIVTLNLEKSTETLPENNLNSDTIIDLEQIMKPNNVQFMINNERLEESVDGLLENETEHEKGPNISRKDATDIENKVNKSNDVKEAGTNRLKEVALKEQTNKTRDIVLLNLGNTTGILSEDNSISSDSIIDSEQNIQLKNLNDKVNNQRLKASENEVLENVVQTEGHQISINVSRIDVTEIENKSNDMEQTNTTKFKEIPLTGQTMKESIILNLRKTTGTLPENSVNSDTIFDLEQTIKPNNVNVMINNERLEEYVDEVLEIEIQTTGHKIRTDKSLKDAIEIENKVNKSNDVKQADTNKLNLENTTGTLLEDKSITIQDNSINSDSIIYLEQNIKQKNVNEMIGASVKGIIDNEVKTTEGHTMSINISRKDVTEIENKVNKSKDVEQTCISDLKEQPNKKDSLLMEDLDEPYESSEEEWNPTDQSEGEFDMDIRTSAVTIKRKNNIVTQKLKFRCPVENCEAVYRKKWLLEDHIRKHNKERPFHCIIEECKKSFTKEAHLKRHNILVHEKSGELACDVKGCGLIYNNKYSLKKHKNQVHNALKWPFFCNECYIGFKKKWQLNQHNYKHTGEPPFKCTMCDIGFTVQRDLTKHNRNHKMHTCHCGQIFERWSHLNRHKKKCSIKEDFVCKICDKKFSKKENLNAHHTGIHQESKEPELFHCPYLNCTRSYKYKKNVNFHISFFHEKNKREEIPCPTCGKIFHMPLYLNRHLEKMHKLPKISKPRATRKDKNKPRTYTAAVLAGLKLSQKEHMDFLKNPKKQLIIRISRIDLGEIETKLSTSNDDVEQTHSNELKDIDLTRQANNKDDILILNLEKAEKLPEEKSITIEENSKNLHKLIDLEHNIQLKISNDVHRAELSVNGIIQNEVQTTHQHKINTRIEETNISSFSDDVVVACNSVLKIIEECIV